jgi:hypothetical protein
LSAPFTRPKTGLSKWYNVQRAFGGGFRLQDGSRLVNCSNAGDLLFHLDKSLTIAVQLLRPDLFFLHAAAVAVEGRVAILSAPPGTGKSTLTLALLQNGFEYLSDELAPIDPKRLTVHPFSHALCLKTEPPSLRTVPDTIAATGRFHVPVNSLGVRAHTHPLLVTAICFVRRDAAAGDMCRPMATAPAVAHMMANALNRLAHPGEGLEVALRLSRELPCFELDSTDLNAACAAVRAVLERPLDGQLATANAGEVGIRRRV